ncbi:PAS domain S-box protein [Gemmata sp. G18]|uniref:histidine kinase n=1 Tax=Gemmata palustris TaxID=2822762 RepID=A0ABS5C460_9BACT|nr:PAS domain S-box protein [Gemmata palustris]MBP3960757.1 PAS domain S-box protein [Gemmata palustris]
MTFSPPKKPFPLFPIALVVAAASGAAVCVTAAPPPVAGPLVGALVLAAAALGWWANRPAPPARAVVNVGPHDSLPESETRLRLLESAVVHAHDAVAIVEARPDKGPGRSVMYVNEAFCRLTGYSRADVIGRSLYMLRGAGSDPDTLARLSSAMNAGTPLRVELRNYRKDGTPFWVDLSAVPVPDPDGNLSHWVMIQRDIDRRKSAERRARQTGQLLRAIIDAFPGPISAKDRDSRYLVMNQFQAELLGVTPEDAVGRTAAELVDAAYGAMTVERDREVMSTCRPIQYEARYPAPIGDARPWLTSKAPLWMPDGIDSEPAGARGVVTVALDISALKTAEDALRRSEERYRQLFRAVPHPVFVYDTQTLRILAVNEAAIRKYGYTRDEFLALTVPDIRLADDVNYAFSSATDSGLPDGPPALRRHRTRSGALINVEVSSFALSLEGRGVKLALVNDVTERYKAEEELRRSEELFRGIFESTSAGVSLTNAEGLFVSCNPAFAAMLGRTVPEVLKLTPASITHPDDLAEQQILMDEVRTGVRDRFSYSKRYLRPDGHIVWVELSFSAVRDAAGGYEYGLGVSVNVTERRLLEDQLRQAQKMEAIGQMAGGVAHDFNNLLTAVLGNLSLVRLPDHDPNRSLLGAVEQAAARAADLTRKLLGYARRNQLVFAPVEPREALGEVLALLRHTVDPRIHLALEVDPDCPAVHADPTLLVQAIMNLGLNARDAMPDGGALTFTAEPVNLHDADSCPAGWDDVRPGRYVRLAVSDTGTGMTPEVQARLFEPFFTTKGIGKGTGLGLPMVHGIVKQHHGWIEVHSNPGAGTRIELNLPMSEMMATPSRAHARTPLPIPIPAPFPMLTPSAPARTPIAPAPATILLVDDEQMIRDLGTAVLTRAGYRIITAEDGQEAVEVFERECADIALVILDVTMPRMSGSDASRHMIRIDPGVRILFSTGYSADDLAELDGSQGLLSKPYRPQELVAAVRAALTITPQPVG